MAGIYANAYVTLIAGNGWDANHGLRGIQGVTEPRHLSSSWKPGLIEDLDPYDSIWYSRGWTFQEMVFSPRKIMFQYQLASWECINAGGVNPPCPESPPLFILLLPPQKAITRGSLSINFPHGQMFDNTWLWSMHTIAENSLMRKIA